MADTLAPGAGRATGVESTHSAGVVLGRLLPEGGYAAPHQIINQQPGQMQPSLAVAYLRLEIPLEEHRGEKKRKIKDQPNCQHGDRMVVVAVVKVPVLRKFSKTSRLLVPAGVPPAPDYIR